MLDFRRSRISNLKTVYKCSTFNDEDEKVKKINGKLRCDDQHSFIIVSKYLAIEFLHSFLHRYINNLLSKLSLKTVPKSYFECL